MIGNDNRKIPIQPQVPTPPIPFRHTCLKEVLIRKRAAGGLRLQSGQPVGKVWLQKHPLAHPCLPVPLSKAGTVIGARIGRTHLTYVIPCTLEFCLTEVDRVAQLHNL